LVAGRAPASHLDIEAEIDVTARLAATDPWPDQRQGPRDHPRRFGGRCGRRECEGGLVDAARTIGAGVVRNTGALTQMSKVLVVLEKTSRNGKIYFVLTAFPIP